MKVSLKLPVAMLFGMALGVGGMQVLHAQQQDIKRNVLQHADLTGDPGKEVYMTLIEAQPGAAFAPHIHHGDEFSYVVEGALELNVAGQAARPVKAGESIHIEREKIHGGKVTSTTPLKLLAIHVVDKGKPLAEAAKE